MYIQVFTNTCKYIQMNMYMYIRAVSKEVVQNNAPSSALATVAIPLCVDMHTWMDIYIYMYWQINAIKFIYVCKNAPFSALVTDGLLVYICTYRYMDVCIYIYVHMNTCEYLCTHICVNLTHTLERCFWRMHYFLHLPMPAYLFFRIHKHMEVCICISIRMHRYIHEC